MSSRFSKGKLNLALALFLVLALIVVAPIQVANAAAIDPASQEATAPTFTGKMVYVQENATAGDGTENKPYGDVATALGQLADGDTLVLKSNVVAQSDFNINKSIKILGNGNTLTVRGKIETTKKSVLENVKVSQIPDGASNSPKFIVKGSYIQFNNVEFEDSNNTGINFPILVVDANSAPQGEGMPIVDITGDKTTTFNKIQIGDTAPLTSKPILKIGKNTTAKQGVEVGNYANGAQVYIENKSNKISSFTSQTTPPITGANVALEFDGTTSNVMLSNIEDVILSNNANVALQNIQPDALSKTTFTVEEGTRLDMSNIDETEITVNAFERPVSDTGAYDPSGSLNVPENLKLIVEKEFDPTLQVRVQNAKLNSTFQLELKTPLSEGESPNVTIMDGSTTMKKVGDTYTFAVAKNDVETPPAQKITITFEVVNGTWAGNGTTITKQYDENATITDAPANMQPNRGFLDGAWDEDPTNATVTAPKTYTYTYQVDPKTYFAVRSVIYPTDEPNKDKRVKDAIISNTTDIRITGLSIVRVDGNNAEHAPAEVGDYQVTVTVTYANKQNVMDAVQLIVPVEVTLVTPPVTPTKPDAPSIVLKDEVVEVTPPTNQNNLALLQVTYVEENSAPTTLRFGRSDVGVWSSYAVINIEGVSINPATGLVTIPRKLIKPETTISSYVSTGEVGGVSEKTEVLVPAMAPPVVPPSTDPTATPTPAPAVTPEPVPTATLKPIKAPKTGDRENITLYGALLVLASVAFVFASKKRKHQN